MKTEVVTLSREMRATLKMDKRHLHAFELELTKLNIYSVSIPFVAYLSVNLTVHESSTLTTNTMHSSNVTELFFVNSQSLKNWGCPILT